MPPDTVISRRKKFHIVAAERVVKSVNVGTAVFADPTTPGCRVHADPDIYRYYSDTSLSKFKHSRRPIHVPPGNILGRRALIIHASAACFYNYDLKFARRTFNCCFFLAGQ